MSLQTKIIVIAVCVVIILAVKLIQFVLKRRVSFGGTPEDPMFFASEDEPAVNAAMAQARDQVGHFINEMNKNEDGFHGAVKVKITDTKQSEYFWLDDLRYTDGRFIGTINNDPQYVKSVKLGDPYEVGRDAICDWLYQKGGKIYGNFTFKAAIRKWPRKKQLDALVPYGDFQESVEEAVRETSPLIKALLKNMSAEEMIQSIQKTNLPEEKKQEFIRKIQARKSDN